MSGDNSPWVSFIYRPPMSWMGFPCGSAGKESACNAGDLGLIPGLGRCPGEGKGSPLQYSGLENSMDCLVYGVSKSQTPMSDFYFTSLPSSRRVIGNNKLRIKPVLKAQVLFMNSWLILPELLYLLLHHVSFIPHL